MLNIYCHAHTYSLVRKQSLKIIYRLQCPLDPHSQIPYKRVDLS